ncbi:hypothetical protein H0H81_008834 [Sphagnurus paluster]|uniref:Uncharacterized protein n=1 Tax=Sphagnurus paluster TaxID=117069 RepID=A0A9P7KIL2_9AGAR|nr:hypothetical protein H0H81_008834 [Sphagnurus paluster]
MSSSPREAHEEPEDKNNLDEVDELPGGDTEGEAAPKDGDVPVKRGRGRPKGSKNKRPGAAPAVPAAGSSSAATPRKRGRPPKEKRDDDGETEPPVKRKRGRPPKNPKPEVADGGATSGHAPEPAVKKKRGRPSKKTSE